MEDFLLRKVKELMLENLKLEKIIETEFTKKAEVLKNNVIEMDVLEATEDDDNKNTNDEFQKSSLSLSQKKSLGNLFCGKKKKENQREKQLGDASVIFKNVGNDLLDLDYTE